MNSHKSLTTSLSSTSALMDSLPYVENVHEDYEEYALALIEEEMKAIEPRSFQKIPPLNFRTSMMQTEYNTLVVMEGDGTMAFRERPKKACLAYQPSKITKPSDMASEAGKTALSRIKSQYEAERIRSMVLEVEKQEGVAIWKDYIAHLDRLGSAWAQSLKQQMDAVEEINFRREQAQTQQVGPEIERLSQKYEQALYRRNQLEYAIEGLRRNGANDTTRKRKTVEG